MPISKGERLAVLIGITVAGVLSISFIWLGCILAERMSVFQDWTSWEASAFGMLIAAFTLVFGIGWAARTRHFVSNIDGSKPEPNSELDITLRYVSNTTEQLVIFCIACTGIAVTAPETAKLLLPVMGCWFGLARAVFLLGYRIHPLARSVGFAATFHPTVALLLYGLSGFFP